MNLLKKLLPKNLSSRFFLILTSPVIFAQIMFGYIFFGRHTEAVIKSIAEVISGEIKAVYDLLDNQSGGINIQRTAEQLGLGLVIIQNSRLKKEGLSKRSRIYKILGKELRNKGISSFFIKRSGADVEVFLYSSVANSTYKMSFSKKRLYSNTTHVVIIWGAASAIVMLLIAFLFLRSQLRAIKRLSKAAVLFGQGVDAHLIPQGAVEIEQAGIAFCEMQKKIKTLLEERMITLAGVSHDLRTPLTRMRLQLSMMSDSPEVRCLRADIDSMIEIISGFLSYSKDQISESRAKYNLFNLLKDVKNQYIANDIRINGNKQIKIFVKLASFKRALNNIISNAVRYAKIVFISFTQSDDRVIISIEDDGIGIKEELIETIFDPFVSDNRNFQTKTNTGLGLSIAKEIITSHGGTISAKKSKRHGGAKFIITLPSSHQISL